MTVIIGAVDPETGDVVLGGDSSAIAEYDMLTIATPKVIRKGEYVFGFAGHFRFAQIIEHAFVPPAYTGGDVLSFMSRQFMAKLQKCLTTAEYARNRDGRMESGGGVALIGFRGRLFCMQNEFELIEPKEGMFSIGIGFPYALGAMDALQMHVKGLEMRIIIAMEATEKYCSGVRGPFHLVRLPHHGQEVARARNSGRNRPRSEHPATRRHRSGVKPAHARKTDTGHEPA